MDKACISAAMMAQLMPMHLILAPNGEILQSGPTVAKLFAGVELTGQSFFERFEVRRPYDMASVPDIIAANGAKLHLAMRNDHQTTLKAQAVALQDQAGVLLDMSFGISVVDTIRTYDLTIADFAATDLAVEMLYLIEAKSAAMTESRKLNARLQGAKIAAEEQAYTDTLTGLKNRRAMDHVLSRFVAADETFGLMQVDLDFFKTVNDTMGHAAGDHVLQQVAKILVEETRSDDLVARIGGDEFVLLFHRLTNIDKLNDIARRIIDRMEVPILFNGEKCHISASIGTTISDYYPTPEVDQMLSDADLALYASKNRGRACNTVFSNELLQQAS
ncbi:diguanylate cyclase domain-containing protein [Profundibacter sp.]